MLSKGKKWSENGSSGGRGGLLPSNIFLDVLVMEAEINCQSEATLRGHLCFLYAWVYELILKVSGQICVDVFLDCFAFQKSVIEGVIYLQSTTLHCFFLYLFYIFFF